MIELNETPVRTSRNFNINNIKIEDLEIPKKIDSFNNMKLDLANFEENIEPFQMIYGIGSILEDLLPNKNLKIKLDKKAINNIEIQFQFDRENINLVDNIFFFAEEDSISNIVLKYTTNEGLNFFHRGIIKTMLEKNAVVNIIAINVLNNNSSNFISIENILEEGSTLNYNIVDFGGKKSITNYYSKLNGKKCINNINTMYLGSKNQLFDLNYIAHLQGEESEINMEIQGALKDNSKKHFKGTIDFKKGAKQAVGNENESCMLLSDEAKSISLPMLLCSEENVIGNHSCSAGKIAENELFYIMSRGFDFKSARKLMVKAKFNKILEKISNEHLRQEIIEEIDNRIDS